MGLQIELGHVTGVANYVADALSRLGQGKAIPSHLTDVQVAAAPGPVRQSRAMLKRPCNSFSSEEAGPEDHRSWLGSRG